MAVLFEKLTDGIALVTLNRPEVLNALDTATKQNLAEIWRVVADDPDIRVAILSGAGPKAFCSGSDMKEMDRSGRTVPTELLLQALPGRMAPLNKPIIAALHGYCLGMGLTLALHCDLRLAAKGTVMGFTEVRHGMISGVSAVMLPQVMPACRALELLLLGRTVTADEAARIGLINRVVDGDILEEAKTWAETIAQNSPVAVQATKHLALLTLRRNVEAERAEIDRIRLHVEASEDFKRGTQAFAQHRPASFSGR